MARGGGSGEEAKARRVGQGRRLKLEGWVRGRG